MITGKPAPLFFRNDYAQRLKKLFEPSIVSYLPLDEQRGSAAFDFSGNGRNGAYTAVTLGQPGIGDGRSAASFDGSTSFCNWYSAALASAFNGAEGTLMARAKVANAGVWTDSTSRFVARLSVDGGSNDIYIIKTSTANQLGFNYSANATQEYITTTDFGGVSSFMALAITWSKSADKVMTYVDGKQIGTTETGLGTWAGNLNPSLSTVGAGNVTPDNVFSGLLAHALLLNRAATAAEILEAYRMAS